MQWDPAQYAKFDTERNQPFFDLTARITTDPSRVLDIGCGPGELTAALAQRWPRAAVLGVDSSPDMVERASALTGGNLHFESGDATTLDTTGFDVVVSNAALQWVPSHRDLLTEWAGTLPPGGWLAFQVPSNFGAPSHVLMRELAESPRWASKLRGVLRHADAVGDPVDYLDLFFAAGLTAQAWQTSYLHVLPGTDPVLEWVRGTGLRPVLQALSDDDAAEFEAEYRLSLRAAYPKHPWGTLFPFLRTFVVATKVR